MAFKRSGVRLPLAPLNYHIDIARLFLVNISQLFKRALRGSTGEARPHQTTLIQAAKTFGGGASARNARKRGGQAVRFRMCWLSMAARPLTALGFFMHETEPRSLDSSTEL